MRGVAAAIVPTVLALLMGVARAEDNARSSGPVTVPLLPGIGAHDPRIRVDPDAIPWRAVGKLQAASMIFRTLCTATLVGPSTVVTAAHCLFNRRTQHVFPPESLHFLIGYSGGRYAGHAVGTKVTIGAGYDPLRPKETIGSDWALVFLDKDVGSADRVLPIASKPPESGANVVLGGYQKDHPLLLMTDPQCRIVGRLADAGDRLLLRHNCTATSGASGAPLLVKTNGKWQIAAIDVASETGIAGGVAVVLDDALKSS